MWTIRNRLFCHPYPTDIDIFIYNVNNFCTEKLYGLGGINENKSFCIKKMVNITSSNLWSILKQMHTHATRKQQTT